ncbi:unnamed protein product [Moneuplotes crassus]|uniref:protein-serine/threonine phosphatase n=1 Tax=Euplotes crassus TaxID=5936 RepID=A0AAD1U3C8_EUPCR|nr:unnamed protein product [Moneuplotes crassus]
MPTTVSSLRDRDQVYNKGKYRNIKSPYFSVTSIVSKSGKNSQCSNRLTIQTALKNIESHRKVSNLFSGMTISSIGNSKNKNLQTYFKTEKNNEIKATKFNRDFERWTLDQRFQKKSSSAMSLTKYLKNCREKQMQLQSNNKKVVFYPKEKQKSRNASSMTDLHSISLPNYDQPTFSKKEMSNIFGFAANTNQGISRNYNEDRVSIIINATCPKTHNVQNWPTTHFFGVFDGHGGQGCSEFLRVSLHKILYTDPCFPSNPKQALLNAFERAEFLFSEKTRKKSNFEFNHISDPSGSCANVALIVEDMCYIANLGDSRAILSMNCGKSVKSMSTDHKPSCKSETNRIVKNGGSVYQTQVKNNGLKLGPVRVLPGRLSVSRAFGNIEAKTPALGGNPNVLIPVPEIKMFKMDKTTDFLLIGSDGIFEKCSNSYLSKVVWSTMKSQENMNKFNFHQCLGECVDTVLKKSIIAGTLDNISCVIIAMNNLLDNIICPPRKILNLPKKIPGSLMLESNFSKGICKTYSIKNKENAKLPLNVKPLNNRIISTVDVEQFEKAMRKSPQFQKSKVCSSTNMIKQKKQKRGRLSIMDGFKRKTFDLRKSKDRKEVQSPKRGITSVNMNRIVKSSHSCKRMGNN